MAGSSARTDRHAALPGVIAVVLIALLALFPPPLVAPALERLSFAMFDAFQRIEPRPYQDAGVRVVDIDEETIRRLGQWPWPRTDIAALTDKLTEAGAAAIAYDVVLSEPDRTSPPRLGDADLLADVVRPRQRLPQPRSRPLSAPAFHAGSLRRATNPHPLFPVAHDAVLHICGSK